jgi:metal-responsive CopG/Arc/MetJ family transcriptional regulator
MKTAISIDKKLFEDAERFSRIAGLSRSKLYSTAVGEYIQNHTPDIITEKLNSYYGSAKSKIDDDLKETACRLFAKEECSFRIGQNIGG